MKFLFIVQGEGRGHMTQAISLYKILVSNGHQVCHVVVGKSKHRIVPTFFRKQIASPFVELESPNFVFDKNDKTVKIFKTILFNLARLRIFLRSITQLNELIKKEDPDVILNFYDFLGGLYYMLSRPKPKHISIAHQYLAEHPKFTFPKGKLVDRKLFLLGNKLTSFGAKTKLALSFQEFENIPEKGLIVVPPLLREEIKQQNISNENYFLVYLVNHGYSEQVEKFHDENPQLPIHCFWDKKNVADVYVKDENLTFHQLDDKKFIEFMAGCKGYLTTAGFESVCEAMLMGKPILMVPVKGHYEQRCNAEDAMKAGAGISSETFDLELLLAYLPKYKSPQNQFRTWCNKTEEFFIQNLTHVN